DLDSLEQQAWREVIAALPAHWVDPAGQILLRRLVAQTASSERWESRLRQLRAENRDAEEETGKLVAMHGAAAKTIAHLLSQLRATPRSRMVSRAAGPQIARTSSLRPWEIRSRGQAQQTSSTIDE